MIKANELRLGNWVAFNNHIMPVDYVQVNARFFSSLCGGRNLNEVKFDEQFNNYWDGIQLTPEILGTINLTIRFPDYPECNIWDMKKNAEWEKNFSIALVKEGWKYMGAPSAKPFHHVHQLQNLYFALTSEELEIKL